MWQLLQIILSASKSNETAEFLQWTVDTLGIENYEVQGATKVNIIAVATRKNQTKNRKGKR